MTSDIRACVAYVAARLITKRSADSVYDHSSTKQRLIGGSIAEGQVSVFDYGANCWFQGYGDGQSFSLHHGASGDFRLEVEGESFRGFDYASRSHFEGRVKEGTVILCDGQNNRWFSYTL